MKDEPSSLMYGGLLPVLFSDLASRIPYCLLPYEIFLMWMMLLYTIMQPGGAHHTGLYAKQKSRLQR